MRRGLILGNLLLLLGWPAGADDWAVEGDRVVRVKRQGRWQVVLDLEPQILAIQAAEEAARPGEQEPPLWPRPRQVDKVPVVSVAVLGLKAKQFDDGLYAAVELAAQSGIGLFQGKKRLLATLSGRLGDRSEPERVVLAATALGNAQPAHRESVDQLISQFLMDDRVCRCGHRQAPGGCRGA